MMVQDLVFYIQEGGELREEIFETKAEAEEFAVANELTDYFVVAFDCQ
jgi:hypothetical protein